VQAPDLGTTTDRPGREAEAFELSHRRDRLLPRKQLVDRELAGRVCV
jgi:hypothetical protein